MKAKELFEYHLPRDFNVAEYGYWIRPDGSYIPVNEHGGHLDSLIAEGFDPAVESFELYEQALDDGWVRVVAPMTNLGEFSYQFKKLNNRTRRALVTLILGLEEYGMYVFQSGDQSSMVPTARQASQHVSGFVGESAVMETATWTKTSG